LSQAYDGTAKNATAATTPNGLAVNLTYNGSAAAPTNAGSYTVVGTVADANYAGSATNTLVISTNSTSLAVSSSANPACLGDSVTFTATLTGVNATGTVQFAIDGSNFGSPVAVSGNTAAVSTSSLSVTNHSVSAVYSGDANNAGSSGSLAGGQTINAPVVISSGPTNLMVCEGSPAVFSATASGTALSYQWLFSTDGGVTFSNLALNATFSSYTNTGAIYADNGFQYALLASGACGSPVTSVVATLTVDRPPVAADTNAGVKQGQSLVLSIAKQLMTVYDPDGDTNLSILTAGPTSTNGGTVALDNLAGTITYTPISTFAGTDVFSYVISDGRVCTASRNVIVTVTLSNAPSLNIVSGPTILTNNHFFVRFAGIPGYNYTIQYTTNFSPPAWNFITNLPVGTNGLLDFEDPTSPRPSSRFYRTTYP
jgi:hypothetical protein